jgi:NADPH-dependent curcumin reductase CurA
MSPAVNRQWVLIERPADVVADHQFQLRCVPVPVPGPDEALVRVVWLGIDPTQRTWLNEDLAYISPVRVGEVMRGSGVGQVVVSNTKRLEVGDWVAGLVGWQDYVLTGREGLFGLNRVPDGIDPKAMLSVYGVNGLTAYFGIMDIGKPIAGDTVFVSAAAGSVGSIAGQIAKIRGCRVIGSAGGAAKCAWVINVAGFDACIDYKAADPEGRLRELAPAGVNVFFDNVGGAILEATLANLALHARVVLCGSISSGYTSKGYGLAPRNYMELGFRRARMEGFIFLDYVTRFPEAFRDLTSWVSEKRIAYAEDIVDGLERAPALLQGLFEGKNLGKQLLRIT